MRYFLNIAIVFSSSLLLTACLPALGLVAGVGGGYYAADNVNKTKTKREKAIESRIRREYESTKLTTYHPPTQQSGYNSPTYQSAYGANTYAQQQQQPYYQQQPQMQLQQMNNQDIDKMVAGDISSQFLKGGLTRAIIINTEVKNGVATLYGNVPSKDVVKRAIEIARRAKGVREVVSRLLIQKEIPSPGLIPIIPPIIREKNKGRLY